MLRCAPGSCSLALSFLAGFPSHGKQGGAGRRLRTERVLTWSWDAHPGPENREVLLGPAVQTGPLRAGWDSTLLVLEQLFRYVCPTAPGVWLQLISNDSYSLSAEFARGVSNQHPWWWWSSSVTQSSAANSLSMGLGRFTQPVLQPVLPHAQGFQWPGWLHSHIWVVLPVDVPLE